MSLVYDPWYSVGIFHMSYGLMFLGMLLGNHEGYVVQHGPSTSPMGVNVCLVESFGCHHVSICIGWLGDLDIAIAVILCPCAKVLWGVEP